MVVVDYENIKDISFKIPELFSDDSKEQVLTLFNEIKDLKNKIYTLREEANTLEKELKEKKKKWDFILPLINLEYNTLEKEEVKGEINVGFNFGTDVNKHIH